MDPDNDNDGMPNLWELDRGFDPLDDADADDDPDLDGVPNLAEFVADTDPHDAQSFFRVLTLARQDNELTLRWNSSSRRRYAVHRTTDFLHWTIIEPEFASQGDVTVWTDAGAFTNPAAFYRIEVFPPDP
jgi:hypothetical protein